MEVVNTGLASPMAGMLALTLLVWIRLFVQRIGYMKANDIDAEQMKAPVNAQELIPPEASSPPTRKRTMSE